MSGGNRKRKGRSQEVRWDDTGSGRVRTEGVRVNLTSFLCKLGFGVGP